MSPFLLIPTLLPFASPPSRSLFNVEMFLLEIFYDSILSLKFKKPRNHADAGGTWLPQWLPEITCELSSFFDSLICLNSHGSTVTVLYRVGTLPGWVEEGCHPSRGARVLIYTLALALLPGLCPQISVFIFLPYCRPPCNNYEISWGDKNSSPSSWLPFGGHVFLVAPLIDISCSVFKSC